MAMQETSVMTQAQVMDFITGLAASAGLEIKFSQETENPQKEKKERKPRKLPKILSKEEIKKVFDALNTKAPTSLRNYVALLFMYRCGLRVSEVTNLSVKDINFETAQVYVQQGKGSVDRYVGMDELLMSWCRKWLAIKPEGEYFFCTLKGKKFANGDRYLRAVCERLSERSGVYVNDNHVMKPIHPHLFRHCYATELVEEGYSIIEVQQLLGHSSVKTTQVYAHCREVELGEKIRRRESIL